MQSHILSFHELSRKGIKYNFRAVPKEGFLHAIAYHDLQHMVIENQIVLLPSYNTGF